MAIQSINQINQNVNSQISIMKDDTSTTPFKQFFDTAMNQLQEVSDLQTTADQMSVDFAVGKIDNIADVMIAQEKASVALQYTVQLRNKLLDAYNEIMRIQL